MLKPPQFVMETEILHMRTILACLLLGSFTLTIAEGKVMGFIFPPFAKEDITIPTHTLSDYPDYDEMRAISVEEWRGIMATGNSSLQEMAAKELVVRGDQKTILRLVYSLKQGNVAAKEILSSSNSLAAIPYLIEDVANGSLAYYGPYFFGDAMTGEGRVRQAVVTCVASALFSATEFTGETRECLRAIGRGNEKQIQGLSDESRFLVQWWLLNDEAFEAGKWNETRPLPQEITYLDPRKDTYFPRDEQWDKEKQPPFGSPAWDLAESFEAWAERIVDPKRRNLDFVALSWDGTKVIEHPAKSLDPKAKPQNRESRKTPAQRNPPETESGDGVARRKGILWITVAAVIMVFLSLVWWIRHKPSARV